jgi:hypothetical protein
VDLKVLDREGTENSKKEEEILRALRRFAVNLKVLDREGTTIAKKDERFFAPFAASR